MVKRMLSILAGIMLCDEVYKEKSNVLAMKKQGAGGQNGQAAASAVNEEESAELERRTIAMIDKINRVL